MIGQFHEVSIGTRDIRASVEFYEQLGFTHAQTGDAWSHPYGVLTDGRLFLGLHQRSFPSPALTFVKPGIASLIPELESRGVEVLFRRTGDDVFNEVALRDPSGQTAIVLEARTYSPVERRAAETSLCGYFSEFSMPATDFDKTKQFWEPLGFVATDESDQPYVHLPLTSDRLNIAFHRPRTLDIPMLVFRDSDMPARIARLRQSGVPLAADLPRGLDPSENALLEAPEGTALLLLTDRG